jgi:PAS domain S-box-containing protein
VTASSTGFAQRWTERVLDCGDGMLSEPDTNRLLTQLTERLADALVAEPFYPAAGREVGAALFGSHLNDPEVIGVSVAFLAELPDALGLAPDAARPRMAELLGAVVTGYSAALGACTIEDLHQQEFISGRDGRQGTAEAALRDVETRFRAVFAGVDTAIAICESNGQIVDANPALADLLRHRLPYLRGRTIYDLVHPDDAAVLGRIIQRDLVHGRRGRVMTEMRFRRRGGSLLTVVLSVSLVDDSDGNPAYLVLAGRPSRSVPPPPPKDLVRGRTRIDLTAQPVF